MTSRPRTSWGKDWWPDDEELDQRLRGRLAVMARNKAHLSWDRVLNKDPVLWPYNLLARETSWSMGRFVRELELAAAVDRKVFQAAAQRVQRILGSAEYWPVSTREYAIPRPGQTDRRVGTK